MSQNMLREFVSVTLEVYCEGIMGIIMGEMLQTLSTFCDAYQ